MADKLFSKEQVDMLRLALSLKLSSLGRASKTAGPGFDELYKRTVQEYRALELIVSKL